MRCTELGFADVLIQCFSLLTSFIVFLSIMNVPNLPNPIVTP